MPNTTQTLAEIDELEIKVLITDELDPISACPNPAVKHESHFMGVPVTDVASPTIRGGAKMEMKMSNICCGAHGLSLMIKTLLFDAGPEGEAWERNVRRLGADIGKIDHIVLSHYHRDHSGGLLKAISMIKEAKASGAPNVVVDLHPDRPEYRGIQTPYGPLSLEADPSFGECEDAGASVVQLGSVHTVLDDMFLVSGDIPRETTYETGLPNAIRFVSRDGTDGAWEPDETISDERYVMCKIKGKGLVVFTGCGHAGIVNTTLNAREVSGGESIYCIAGGFHMSDATPDKMEKTVNAVTKLAPNVLLGGHCTGWRFKMEIEKTLPKVMVPCTVGMTYQL